MLKRGRGRGLAPEAGFTLVEILVVVAIIGILAMIAIVNYRNALQKAKQKRTMTDMRALATAWESRANDLRGYNAAGWNVPANILDTPELVGLLAPTYLKNIPSSDGWNQAFEFSIDEPIGGDPATTYGIRSSGSDLAFEGGSYDQGTFTRFDCDIVYSNGGFVRYPETQ